MSSLGPRVVAPLVSSGASVAPAPVSAHLPPTRLALLIGSTDDTPGSPNVMLPGVRIDVETMRRLLADELPLADRFHVTVHYASTPALLQRALSTYASRLASLGHKATGLVYFAGHGSVLDNRQMLAVGDADVDFESHVLRALTAAAPHAAQFVILDCCRTALPSPLSGALLQRSLTPEVGSVAPPVAIICSCSAGQSAGDGVFVDVFRSCVLASGAPGRPWPETMRLVDASLASRRAQRPQVIGPATFNNFCFVTTPPPQPPRIPLPSLGQPAPKPVIAAPLPPTTGAVSALPVVPPSAQQAAQTVELEPDCVGGAVVTTTVTVTTMFKPAASPVAQKRVRAQLD